MCIQSNNPGVQQTPVGADSRREPALQRVPDIQILDAVLRHREPANPSLRQSEKKRDGPEESRQVPR